ncbi:MAG TPA: hypothetical protein PKZ97_12570 [Azospirillaceae bacterium]|nr:hypothetical protein [Azospirillaceae bacterium]HRQ81941.1 hypothetical protein [Azospirillaceae bacterium]
MFPPLEPHLIRACKKLKLIKPAAAEWINAVAEPLFIAGRAPRSVETAVMTTGGVMTAEEMKAARRPLYEKISAQFLAALTAKGKKDPREAIARTLHLAMRWRANQRQLEQAKIRGWAVEVSVAMDNDTCEAAKALHGEIRSPDDPVAFPLEGCEKPLCRCGHLMLPPRFRGG